MKIKPMKKIQIIMLSFGLLMGLIFPIYAGYFVNFIPEKKIYFIIGCIIAGITVGVFNFFITKMSLRKIIKDITETSDIIYKNTNLINHSIDILQGKTSDNSTITQQLSATMEQTSTMTEDVNKNILEINAFAEIIFQGVSEGQGLSKSIQAKSMSLTTDMLEIKTTTNAIYLDTKNKLEQAISKLSEVDKISQFFEHTLKITHQIKLLSLNAAIESAKAGSEGAGFSVIAREIGKLAEESSVLVNGQKESIKAISDSVSNLVETSSQVLQFIEESILDTNEKIHVLGEQYTGDVNNFNQLMDKFTTAINEFNLAMKIIVDSIGQTADCASEGSAGIEDIFNKTEIMKTEVEMISQVANNYLKDTNKLNKLIAEFK